MRSIRLRSRIWTRLRESIEIRMLKDKRKSILFLSFDERNKMDFLWLISFSLFLGSLKDAL